MDLGYVFVAKAFGIQLIWALAVLLLALSRLFYFFFYLCKFFL